jgi:hypothetical protein
MHATGKKKVGVVRKSVWQVVTMKVSVLKYLVSGNNEPRCFDRSEG